MLHHPYTCIANNLSTKTPVILRASRVPASRLGRLFHYGCKLLPRPCPRPFAKKPLTRNISYDCCSTCRITLMGRRIRIYPAVNRRKQRRKERWECVYERCEYQAARLYPRPHEGCCIKVGPIHVYPRYVFFLATSHPRLTHPPTHRQPHAPARNRAGPAPSPSPRQLHARLADGQGPPRRTRCRLASQPVYPI